MNTIKWTISAKNAYLNILEMLCNDWNDEVAYNFYEATERLLDGLRNFKNLCPPSPKSYNFRRCVINKHTSFTYRTTDNEVEIVAFYFNKTNW